MAPKKHLTDLMEECEQTLSSGGFLLEIDKNTSLVETEMRRCSTLPKCYQAYTSQNAFVDKQQRDDALALQEEDKPQGLSHHNCPMFLGLQACFPWTGYATFQRKKNNSRSPFANMCSCLTQTCLVEQPATAFESVLAFFEFFYCVLGLCFFLLFVFVLFCHLLFVWLCLFDKIAHNVAFLLATEEIAFVQAGQSAMEKAQTNAVQVRGPNITSQRCLQRRSQNFSSVQTEKIQLYSSEHEISLKNYVTVLGKVSFLKSTGGGRNHQKHHTKHSSKYTKKQEQV